MKAVFVLSLLLAGQLAGQNLSYGFRAGASLNDAFSLAQQFSTQKLATTRLTIGPTAEVRLPFGLGVQVDALYTRHTVGASSAGTWEIPLLAKYRFPGLLFRPFVEGGVSFQRFGDVAKLITTQSVDSSRRGFVLGTGVEIKLVKVRISPEIRMTRWGDAKLTLTPAALLNASSQAQFIVGLTF